VSKALQDLIGFIATSKNASGLLGGFLNALWHKGVLMDDKRVTQRQKVIKAGTISLDGSGIDCVVRNMSVGGANLEVESQIGIPSSFELVINVEHSNHHCHVVWRKARRIGLAFD
jgi:hypothetical protein